MSGQKKSKEGEEWQKDGKRSLRGVGDKDRLMHTVIKRKRE